MLIRKSLHVILIALLCIVSLFDSASAADWIWARGNLHTHTTNSDGDSAPQVVCDWYRDHGYQFLVISDHAKVTDVVPLNKAADFVVIPGEELEVLRESLPIHGNAIGATSTIPNPSKLTTPARSVQHLVDVIADSGAIPTVNHPNWHFSLTHRELLSIRRPYLLEIANMCGDSNNNPGSLSRYSTEQTWDILLSNGQKVMAYASDDTHGLKNEACKGWVVCRVPKLDSRAILDALRNGDFYASTGPEISDYAFDGREFRVSVVPKEKKTYLIRFVGKWGQILHESVGHSASYVFVGNRERNSYIRCKVICSDGTVAWTQAYRL